MHLKSVILLPEMYPTHERYPFNQRIFHSTRRIDFTTAVTLFVGENGTGKSTLLEAIARKCGIHIWGEIERTRFENNPFEEDLYKALAIEWTDGGVPGSFFSSQFFRNFARMLDEWAAADPEMFSYFGGKSLVTQSHGQSLMSYFKSRYCIKGLYFLDEPETALSPTSQLELLTILKDMGRAGHAQFIIASHSPILLACPDAIIYSFDKSPVRKIEYEETEHYRTYKNFLENRDRYL